jgi:hypothetical protein
VRNFKTGASGWYWCRAGGARQAAVFARLGIRPFGMFEGHELDLLASTATNGMRLMGSQYQPDALARESTPLISPPKNPCWRCGVVPHGKPRFSRGWERTRTDAVPNDCNEATARVWFLLAILRRAWLVSATRFNRGGDATDRIFSKVQYHCPLKTWMDQ